MRLDQSEQEVVSAYFKIPSQSLPCESDKNHGKRQRNSRYPSRDSKPAPSAYKV